MRHVLIVIGTNHFHDVVLLSLHIKRDAPRLREVDRIVVGDCPFNSVGPSFGERFRNVELFAVLVAGCVEPASITYAGRIHMERVAFIAADGIAIPSDVLILGVRAIVCEDAAEGMIDLEQDRHHPGTLDYLERERRMNRASRARRLAVAMRIVATEVGFESVGAKPSERKRTAEGACKIGRIGRLPDTVEIGKTIAGRRQRGRQGQLRVVAGLRECVRRERDEEEETGAHFFSIHGAAVFGGSSENLRAIAERNGSRIHCGGAVFGAVAFNSDLIAGFEASFLPTPAGERVRITGFAGPVRDLAVFIGGIDVKVHVGVHPIKLNNHAGEGDGLLVIVFGSEGVMGERGQRREYETGQDVLHGQDALHIGQAIQPYGAGQAMVRFRGISREPKQFAVSSTRGSPHALDNPGRARVPA